MYTANITDTVMFWNLGKQPSSHLQSLKSAVEEAGTEMWVPAAVYHELADAGSTDSPTNPYLDTAIEEGWLRVASPLPGDRTEGFDNSAGPVEKLQFVTLSDPFIKCSRYWLMYSSNYGYYYWVPFRHIDHSGTPSVWEPLKPLRIQYGHHNEQTLFTVH
jgi:hypothetical protein